MNKSRYAVRTTLVFVLSFFALFLPDALHAFSSSNVPIEDPVYYKLSKLTGYGLIRSSVYGQRPWSRNEIARQIAEAMKHRDEMCPNNDTEKLMQEKCRYINSVLGQLEGEFHAELVDRGDVEGEKKTLRAYPLDELRVDFTALDSPFRQVPPNNGVGKIEAVVNNIVAYRAGRHIVDGNTAAIETTSRARLTRYLSFYFRPRFELLDPSVNSSFASASGSDSKEFNFIVQDLYAKFTIANVELEAGRDALILGQGPYGGVLASSNARPRDMITLSNDTPFKLPWIFKYLGWNKYTLFVGNLGPEYIFKDAFFYGLAATLKPASFIELGFEHEITMGGDGAPAVSIGDIFSEFFLVRQNGGRFGGPNKADHRFGLNLRFSIPPLRHTVVYGEGIFEDFGRESFWLQFTQQMGFLGGIFIPVLTADGANDLRIQYEHIPAGYGRHGGWISGLSLNNLLRGSAVGPQGQSVSIEWNHILSDVLRINSMVQYINSGNDQFKTELSSTGGADKVVKITDNPQEHRFLCEAQIYWRVQPWMLAVPMFAYEHIENFDFVQDASRENFMAGFEMRFDLNY